MLGAVAGGVATLCSYTEVPPPSLGGQVIAGVGVQTIGHFHFQPSLGVNISLACFSPTSWKQTWTTNK